MGKSDAHKFGNLTTNYAYNLALVEAGMCKFCTERTDGRIAISSQSGDSKLGGWGCQCMS